MDLDRLKPGSIEAQVSSINRAIKIIKISEYPVTSSAPSSRFAAITAKWLEAAEEIAIGICRLFTSDEITKSRSARNSRPVSRSEETANPAGNPAAARFFDNAAEGQSRLLSHPSENLPLFRVLEERGKGGKGRPLRARSLPESARTDALAREG